jgi:hypothetical protein
LTHIQILSADFTGRRARLSADYADYADFKSKSIEGLELRE